MIPGSYRRRMGAWSDLSKPPGAPQRPRIRSDRAPTQGCESSTRPPARTAFWRAGRGSNRRVVAECVRCAVRARAARSRRLHDPHSAASRARIVRRCPDLDFGPKNEWSERSRMDLSSGQPPPRKRGPAMTSSMTEGCSMLTWPSLVPHDCVSYSTFRF